MTVIPLSALPARYAGQGRIRYIIDGVLPVGVTVVYGPSGVGKTGLAVATAMAIARGVPWAGRKVAPGPVMYLAAENFLGVLDRFYAAAIEANSTHDVPVTIADRLDQALAEKGGRAALARAIADAGGGDPRLIVVDACRSSGSWTGSVSAPSGSNAAGALRWKPSRP